MGFVIILLMILHSLKEESIAKIDDYNKIEWNLRLGKVKMDTCGPLEHPGNLFLYLTRGQIQ